MAKIRITVSYEAKLDIYPGCENQYDASCLDAQSLNEGLMTLDEFVDGSAYEIEAMRDDNE